MADEMNVKKLRDIVDQLRTSNGKRNRDTLADLASDYPALTAFLLGKSSAQETWPPGRLYAYVVGDKLRIVLSIPQLEIEAQFDDKSWVTLLDTIENDLDTDSTKWQLTWKARQQMENKRVSSLLKGV